MDPRNKTDHTLTETLTSNDLKKTKVGWFRVVKMKDDIALSL